MLDAEIQQQDRIQLVQLSKKVPMAVPADKKQARQFIVAVQGLMPFLRRLDSAQFSTLEFQIHRLEIGLNGGSYRPDFYFEALRSYRDVVSEIVALAAHELSASKSPATYFLLLLGLLLPALFPWSVKGWTSRISDAGVKSLGAMPVQAIEPYSPEISQLLLWQSRHDGLTKLPNQLHFLEIVGTETDRMKGVKNAVGSADKNVEQCAVFNIDLDRFRRINDSLGHNIGNKVLSEVAHRITMCVSENDSVSRLNGNEFAVLIRDYHSLSEIEKVAQNISERVKQVFETDGCETFLTTSIGITLIPRDSLEPFEIMRNAEVARASAQDQGGNNICFYTAELSLLQKRRIEIEAELRKALRDGQLELYFQPIVDYMSGRVLSAESLLRWKHPQWGMVSPAEFIPVAEQSGLILEIGTWVIGQAIAQMEDWLVKFSGRTADPDEAGNYFDEFRLTVNISGRQLQNIGDREALATILEHGPSEHIAIEVTESVMVGDNSVITDFFARIQKSGVYVYLDDFGTGFSSLSYLKEYDFNCLKIDKSFIDKIETSNKDLALVACIVSMGKILGMKVVAEGVESKGQLDLLSQVGCNLIQGYYFAKPMPAKAFLKYLETVKLPKKGDRQLIETADPGD
ncbi:MAG: bifunctional diguanylate cyclase/phosphodiesterase [Pseudomonadales bacterium]|nr:bifunctional diguanylate cyclase/phosphodiesterase [Pseudomonadales bacterium]